jgi:hypothetical protein
MLRRLAGVRARCRNPEPKAKDLFQVRRGSQVVRQRSAKPLFGGSIPPRASTLLNHLHHPFSITGCHGLNLLTHDLLVTDRAIKWTGSWTAPLPPTLGEQL